MEAATGLSALRSVTAATVTSAATALVTAGSAHRGRGRGWSSSRPRRVSGTLRADGRQAGSVARRRRAAQRRQIGLLVREPVHDGGIVSLPNAGGRGAAENAI